MRKVLLVAALAAAPLLTAAPASACNTVQVGPFPTYQVCVGPDLEDIIK